MRNTRPADRGIALTEAEWLACGYPSPLLDHLAKDVSDRKHWLRLCAGARQLPPLMASTPDRQCVELKEQWADGEVGDEVEFPRDERYIRARSEGPWRAAA
jgi:hypothetical protein